MSAKRIPPTDSDLEHARYLVMCYGWNSTSYQILNPGIQLWFSADGEAVTGFVCKARTRVVVGAPVCRHERLAAVVVEFENDATAAGQSVIYFCAERRLETVLRESRSHAMVRLGAQPVWHPDNWGAIIAGRSSLRQQLNRARNKGVAIKEWPGAAARNNPTLFRLLTEWLQTRGLPTLHFMVEPNTLGQLRDRRVFVAERMGKAVGFLVASPIVERHGWLIEQFVRGTDAPNGTAELMIDAAICTVAREGFHYVTLGLSPLSQEAPDIYDSATPLVKFLLFWVRAHGTRFYNFLGLEAFKAKFQPEEWEPVYAIMNRPKFTITGLYAVAAAFSDGSPVLLVVRAILRAARQEFQWFLSPQRR